ncbi:transcription termination factor 2-like isoform X2 [Tachypleus tridentatus]|uniref:transcription termination factor 2-like isoform X2 n=1 Tax=Tachypleus tridentatus TaxID=6853 RepID=UPI003FD35F8B
MYAKITLDYPNWIQNVINTSMITEDQDQSKKYGTKGNLCYLKTGTTDNNSKFGKSYYICPLRPQCLFCEPADILPSICTKHKGSIVELQCLKSTSGEKRHYFRCKEGKEQSGLWCGYKNVEDLSEDKDSNMALKEKSIKSDKLEKCKLVETTKQANSYDWREEPSTNRVGKHDVSSGSDSDDCILESPLGECIKLNKIHTESNQDIFSENPTGNICHRQSKMESSGKFQSDLKMLEGRLSQKKDLLHKVSLTALPDGGAKIKNQIEELEKQISGLRLEMDSNGSSGKDFISLKLDDPGCYDAKVSSLRSVNEKYFEKSSYTTSIKPITTGKIPERNNGQSGSHQNVKTYFKSVKSGTVSRVPAHIMSKSTQFIKNEIPEEGQRKMQVVDDVGQLSKHALQQLYHAKSTQHTLYGRRMIESRKAEVRSVTKEAIEKLHKSLETCPSENQELTTPERLRTLLMPHQRRALAWLFWRERQHPPGGILADDMGLGKTLTMISLIMKQKENIHVASGQPSDPVWMSKVHQWHSEVKKHCQKDALKVLLYHGSNREKCVSRLASCDIVITTYNLVSLEVGSGKEDKKNESKEIVKEGKGTSILMHVAWERIILDEAHNIKNRNSAAARAVCCLHAKYRWVMTGTPIHNSLTDMYSLLRFLKCSPFDEYQVWKKWVDNNSIQGSTRLNTLVKTLLLRRTKKDTDTKGNPLVELPPKKTKVILLHLTTKEKEVYEKLLSFSRSMLVNYLEKETEKQQSVRKTDQFIVKRQETENKKDVSDLPFGAPQISGKNNSESPKSVNASFFLTLLLRLQQCCAHLSLLAQVVENDVLITSSSDGIEDKEDKLSAQLMGLSLRDKNLAECSLLHQNISQKDCSSSLNLGIYKNDPDFKKDASSTKVTDILVRIKEISKQSTSSENIEKCVIVSQWTSMLEVIAHHLKAVGISYYLIQGKVSAEDRMKAVDDFNNNPHGIKVMLLSLKAGGVGLNLTGGNHLFLMDLHWNPALDIQACDRVYRMGQKKEVTIYRFICQNTIEEKIQQLQKKKLHLAGVIEGAGQKAQMLTLDDLKLLFGV